MSLTSGLVSAIVSQFARPRGVAGRIVGTILAKSASNVRRSRWTVDLLGISAGERILEIGCGPGVALAACLERLGTGTAIGVDHSGLMVATAGRQNAKAVREGRLRFIAGTIDDLRDDEQPFDRIFSINVIQFVPDKAMFIRTLSARLASNGILATTYQPRGANPTREEAFAMARLLTKLMTEAGLTNLRTEVLEMESMPAVCVLGHKA